MTQVKPKFRIEVALTCTHPREVSIDINFEHLYRMDSGNLMTLDNSLVETSKSGMTDAMKQICKVWRLHSDEYDIEVYVATDSKLLLKKTFKSVFPVTIEYKNRKDIKIPSILKKELDLIPKPLFDKRRYIWILASDSIDQKNFVFDCDTKIVPVSDMPTKPKFRIQVSLEMELFLSKCDITFEDFFDKITYTETSDENLYLLEYHLVEKSIFDIQQLVKSLNDKYDIYIVIVYDRLNYLQFFDCVYPIHFYHKSRYMISKSPDRILKNEFTILLYI